LKSIQRDFVCILTTRKVDLDKNYPEVSFSLPKIERPSLDWLRTKQACPSPVCKHIANDLPLLRFVTLPAITKTQLSLALDGFVYKLEIFLAR